MMAALTGMAESQLHKIFEVAKTGTLYSIKISASDKLMKGDVLANHINRMRFVPGFEDWGDMHDGDAIYPPVDDEHHLNYVANPLQVKRASTLDKMITTCGYHQEMASVVRALETGLYDLPIILFLSSKKDPLMRGFNR